MNLNPHPIPPHNVQHIPPPPIYPHTHNHNNPPNYLPGISRHCHTNSIHSTSSVLIPNQHLNPFEDPPINCSETDVRWVWRKALEERRGHVANRKFYSHYVGTKKSRKFRIESPSIYRGNHHLKHLVKIGCPKHDLYPILNGLGYNVDPAICSHQSHFCPAVTVSSKLFLLNTISMKDTGLIFKRNAFSMQPLRIKYISNNNDKNDTSFFRDIYIQRIANTNFSKEFRPGSYGKLQSQKKGSWKQGKIFYVFEGNELVLTINNNLFIAFDLKSCASNGNDEQNTIDGWKNIVGGVGLYRPPESRNIASVLVLRKHTNYPLECLENSSIKIYTNTQNNNNNNVAGGKLYIGTQIFDLSRNNDTALISNPVPSNIHSSSVPSIPYHNNNNNDCDDRKNNINNQSSKPQPVNNTYHDGGNVIYNNNNTTNNCNNKDNNDDLMQQKVEAILYRMQKEFEMKCDALQYQNDILMQKCHRLQISNMQFMEKNANLEQEIVQLELEKHRRCLIQQQQRNLNEQIMDNTDEFPVLLETNEVNDIYPNGNYHFDIDNYQQNNNQQWNMMPH